MDKRYFEGMSELEEAARGVLAVPVPEKNREEAYELTRQWLEKAKQRKFSTEDLQQSR